MIQEERVQGQPAISLNEILLSGVRHPPIYARVGDFVFGPKKVGCQSNIRRWGWSSHIEQDLHNNQRKTVFDRNTKNGNVNAYYHLRWKNDRLFIYCSSGLKAYTRDRSSESVFAIICVSLSKRL
ncbi:hypothetical protein FRACYDRAFT_249439 [Fragilariopsis cylindrus CCMP1102]|uniref:Uncharacterized protein n=1 Tax=Fragilariopsis cylindrus CCMP1102 TaxID=635003 RepID=A0A1E7ERT9_9STRA|nr:hypothetical protein FRACYDRAFT_249439 [Fragilariopsis cylindrus CCMP1102]|eukprot:OEU08547.1 hypothetical protein FRACYDRAFT_249439 [Fragilariopsis cylindrus CCMP1102]